MTLGMCPDCGKENDFNSLPPLSKIKCKYCDTELIIPLPFGDFQLTELLEDHKVFRKYLGSNLKDDSICTVTILNKKFNGFRECKNYCKKEAKDLFHLLKHPNIIPILSYGEAENTFFIVEPYIESFKLSEYNPRTLGEFEPESVFTAFKSIGSVLSDAHHKGFTHHNICPDNILIDANGTVKIQNFFISRVEYKYTTESKTFENVSEYYISPEKAQKFSEDEKGDIFSLGVMLYFILTGSYPFQGKNKEATIFSRVKRTQNATSSIPSIPYIPPLRVDAYRKDITIEYAELIDSLLQPYPIQRPKAAKFVARLNIIEAEIEKQKKLKVFNNVQESKPRISYNSNSDLGKALKDHELILHYQPIINIQSNKIVGMEAFLRWLTPVGTIPPSQFLPNAEKDNLIHDVGLWAINEACSQLNKWHNSGFKDLYLTLNISPSQLTNDDFESSFFDILTNNNIEYKHVELEISQPESVPKIKIPDAKYTDFIKIFNSRISIEELGSQYSSLQQQFSKFSLHSIKIDNDYLFDINKASKELDTYKSIIAFANFLSVPTVAEKIETEEQVSFLSQIGCTYAQGYYFTRPVSADEATALLQKKNK